MNSLTVALTGGGGGAVHGSGPRNLVPVGLAQIRPPGVPQQLR